MEKYWGPLGGTLVSVIKTICVCSLVLKVIRLLSSPRHWEIETVSFSVIILQRLTTKSLRKTCLCCKTGQRL